jgi:antibiotic biosynthesis monooxygenase (ABM) superfamily enzyme
MKQRKEATPKFIITMCIVYGLFVIIQSVQIIITPHTFVRVISLVTVILISSIIGAFIRELFILKKKVTN